MPRIDRGLTQQLIGLVRPIAGDPQRRLSILASLASLVPLEQIEDEYAHACRTPEHGGGHLLALAGLQILHVVADEKGVVAQVRALRDVTVVEVLDVADLDNWQGGLAWTVLRAAIAFSDGHRIELQVARDSGDTQWLGALIAELARRREHPGAPSVGPS